VNVAYAVELVKKVAVVPELSAVQIQRSIRLCPSCKPQLEIRQVGRIDRHEREFDPGPYIEL
jgi:hypothetical protein